MTILLRNLCFSLLVLFLVAWWTACGIHEHFRGDGRTENEMLWLDELAEVC